MKVMLEASRRWLRLNVIVVIRMFTVITLNMPKRHNNLRTGTSFFISSAGKIERVQEFRIKLFQKLFHCR